MSMKATFLPNLIKLLVLMAVAAVIAKRMRRSGSTFASGPAR